MGPNTSENFENLANTSNNFAKTSKNFEILRENFEKHRENFRESVGVGGMAEPLNKQIQSTTSAGQNGDLLWLGASVEALHRRLIWPRLSVPFTRTRVRKWAARRQPQWRWFSSSTHILRFYALHFVAADLIGRHA